MKRIIVALLLLCAFSPSNIIADEKFILDATLTCAPWFYEPQYGMNSISMDADISVGYDFGSMTIAVKPFCTYASFNGSNTARLLEGAWFDIGAGVVAGFRPFQWGEVAFGAGGFYQRSSFQYNDSGWLGTNRAGISLTLDLTFAPFSFANLTLSNRLDEIFAFDAGASEMIPNYSVGLRVELNPGFEWLDVFAEANALYLEYESDVRSVASWMFEARVGATLHLSKTNNEIIEHGFDALASPAPGVEASFSTIVFEPGKDVLASGSHKTLDALASVLGSRKSLVVSIEAYAEYSGNPVSDLDLVARRGQVIKNYLVGKGADGTRVKVAQKGHVTSPGDASSKPNVIIKILSLR